MNNNGDNNVDEQIATTAEIVAFCLVILALIILNLGPNVTAFVIALDTAPSKFHEGAYFGFVAMIGKLGAVAGWFIVQAIEKGADSIGGSDNNLGQTAGNCGLGWVYIASSSACLIAVAVSYLVRDSPRRRVTRIMTNIATQSRLDWNAIHSSIFRHRLVSGAQQQQQQQRDTQIFQQEQQIPSRRQANSGQVNGKTHSNSDSSSSMVQESTTTDKVRLGEFDFMIPFSRLKVGKRFASGGCGQVYCGEMDTEQVALKELFETILTGCTDEILYEANMLMRLQHPNMVRFFGLSRGRLRSTTSFDEDESFDDDADPMPVFIVTEFCSGGNIGELLRGNRNDLLLQHILKYAMDLTTVMQFLHDRPNPIVHLDLKPENLLLAFQHPSSIPTDIHCTSHLPKLKLCDLGVAKIQGSEVSGAVDNVFVGTLMYMPPEMLQQIDSHISGTAADVYSAAITFYYMFTGCTPFSIRGLTDPEIFVGLIQSQIRPLIPSFLPVTLEKLLNSMWSQAPDERIDFAVSADMLARAQVAEKSLSCQTFIGSGSSIQKDVSENRQNPLQLPSNLFPRNAFRKITKVVTTAGSNSDLQNIKPNSALTQPLTDVANAIAPELVGQIVDSVHSLQGLPPVIPTIPARLRS